MDPADSLTIAMPAPRPVGLPFPQWKKLERGLKNVMLFYAADDEVDEEDIETILLAALCHQHARTRRVREHLPIGRPPRMQDFSENDIFQNFGFRDSVSLGTVMSSLNLPEFVRCPKRRYKMEGESAFLLLLARLHDAGRFSRFESMFHRDVTQLSAIFGEMLNWMYKTHALPRIGNLQWVKERMCTYNMALNRRFEDSFSDEVWYENLAKDVWAFIDGTLRPCARPSSDAFPGLNLQKDLYTGYKKTHALKYQAVHAPDGLCVHLFGAIPGKWHDIKLFAESKIEEALMETYLPGDTVYKLLGDPAYARGLHMCTGFRNPKEKWKKHVNCALSSARVCVEWGFGNVARRWTFLNDKGRQKLFETGLQQQYFVCTFLTNLITCVEGGNQTSTYFECYPPTVHEYMSLTTTHEGDL